MKYITDTISYKKKRALGFFHSGKLTEARALYEECLIADHSDPDAWLMLGLIGGREGHYDYAVNCFRNVVSLCPDNIEARLKLALALRFTGNPDKAENVFRSVLELQPENAEAGDGLGYLLFDQGRRDEAAEIFRRTLKYNPQKAERHSAYGSILQSRGMCQAAIAEYKSALEINPDLFVAPAIGTALQAQGRSNEALKYFREGIARQVDNDSAWSGLLMALNYLHGISRAELYREHRRWGEARYDEADHGAHFENICDTDRKLRVGYVSPDFRSNHSVTYFAEPLFASHDRQRYEIFGYSMLPRPDETTMRFRGLSDHWRDIYGMKLDQIVDVIRKDRIDILVDLAGHTAYNRIGVFARKAAPIQVTYIGYPNTTGLQAMEYRLTDTVADQPDADQFYTESLVRLPGCFLCYQPPLDAPAVNSLPALQTGRITFGSFNNLAKVNEEVIQLWSKVLDAIPESRLILKYRAFNEACTRERYLMMFSSRGISAGRIELLGHVESRDEHLAMYNKVDIALDTFPYNGTTTTCESLWMGVPVMTLTGDAHAGRVGASLLRSAGLQDWIADTSEGFVKAIRCHVSDIEQLANLRARLRDNVAASRLCDRERFIPQLESAYRDMWRKWCGQQAGHAG